MGCIALRRFDAATCEVKRLYVLPAARGTGLGRRLAAEVMAEARRLGYAKAVLDTGAFMPAAQKIYESLGFTDIPAYYENPYEDHVRYMGASL